MCPSPPHPKADILDLVYEYTPYLHAIPPAASLRGTHCSMLGSSRDSRRHSSALCRKLARISAGRIMPAVSKVNCRLELVAASLTRPKMTDTALADVLRPFWSNQNITALCAWGGVTRPRYGLGF